MKKNKALIGSALALLIAPTVLSNLSPQTVSAADTTEIGLVGTVSGSGVLVDDQGQAITSTFLPNNSSWKLGNTKQINGVTYYQVATNEWIAANNLSISNQQAQTQADTTYSAPVASTGQTGTVKWTTAVVNSQGQAISGVMLPVGSSWSVGPTVTINGTAHIQIATDEYVDASVLNLVQSANDVTTAAQNQQATQQAQESQEQVQQQPVVGTVVNGPANVYDTSMDSFSGRQLQEGSEWKVGQQVQNKYGYTFYQVSNNEWTQSSNMQLTQNADQSSVTSEPEFATSVTQ